VAKLIKAMTKLREKIINVSNIFCDKEI